MDKAKKSTFFLLSFFIFLSGFSRLVTPMAARRKPRVSTLGDEPPPRFNRGSTASEEEAPTLRGRGVFTAASDISNKVAAEDESREKIRLLTFNCLATPFTNKQMRLAQIAKEIASLKPDIICLQEVMTKKDVRFLVEALEKELGEIDYFYKKAWPIPNDLLTIIRGGIEEEKFVRFNQFRKFTSLAILDWHCTKGYHRLKIKVKGKPLYLYNLHTTRDYFKVPKLSTKSLVTTQIKQLSEELNSIQEPTIVCGDFNFRPDSQGFEIFTKELGFKEVLNGEDKITKRNDLYWSWLPGVPERADYVFYNNLLFGEPDAKIVFDKPFKNNKKEYYMSDHFGILVDFE